MENLSGKSIKGYELLEQIGRGSVGAVYRAYQSAVGREVAVKIILPGYANQPDFIRCFEAEAQLIARLEHLHIVPLYDYWREPDGAYLVMRCLRGGSVQDALRSRPFELGSAALLLDQVAAALATAHAHGIVHQDVKPSNILLDEEGNAYLADFGIARNTRGNGGGSEPLALAGSPAYLSPEQARGEAVTTCTDVYSLGVTLYETLTGAHPFPSRTDLEHFSACSGEPLPPIEFLEPAVGEAVGEVLGRATATVPAQRYPDVLSMAAAFREAARLGEDDLSNELVQTLTLREQEILQLIVQRYSNRQIAQELFVELSTVKWHIRQLYAKLGVRSRRQAMVKGRELALLVPGGEVDRKRETATSSISIPRPAPINPYKGLRAFEAADCRHFFGRELVAQKIVSQMADEKGGDSANARRFLAVVGRSGSGKSSLVKAGVIPLLRQGAIPGSDRWIVAEMTPGTRPLAELEAGLIRVAAGPAEDIRQQLEGDGNGLLRAAELALPPDESQLVLVVDQFEELFTLVADEGTRGDFLKKLVAAVTDPQSRMRLIITLRADYYDRLLSYPEFGALLRNQMEALLPLTAEELERAITYPLREMDIRYEDGLVATIIDDVLYQPGALPLLQYALTELFERCAGPLAVDPGRVLTRTAYEAIGRVTAALSRRAEELYQEQDETGREVLRQIFLRLVSVEEVAGEAGVVGAGGAAAYTRRRVAYSELTGVPGDTDLIEELIETFAAYRLLTLDHDPVSRGPTVEVAHDALLQGWDRLSRWLEASREDLVRHRQLHALSEEWLESGRDSGLLLRQTRLDQLAAWATGTDLALTNNERGFLEASVIAREERRLVEQARQRRELETAQRLAQTEARRAAEQAEANRRLRALATGLALLFLVAVVAAFLAWRGNGAATAQARLATARELSAAAISNLDVDPERSILLALRAVEISLAGDGAAPSEAEEALHRALLASRVLYSVPGTGAVAYSGDGRLLATAGGNDAIVHDAVTGEALFTLSGHEERLRNLAFSGDGRRLATTSDDNSVRVWDVTRQVPLLTLAGPADPVELVSPALDPHGALVAATSSDGKVYVWQVPSGERLLTLQHEQSGAGLAFSGDGRRLATASSDNTARVWEIPGGRELLRLDLGNHVNDVAFGPEGERVAVGSTDGFAYVLDLESGEKIAEMHHASFVYGIDFSPDGRLIATGGLDGAARVWDAATGRELVTLVGHTSGIHNVAFSADGSQLATGSVDGTTRVWGITASGSREWLTVGAHDNMVYSVTYDPAGTRLASASASGAATVWDAATGRELLGLRARVTHPETGHELVLPTAHRGEAYRITFNAQGTRLATVGEDGVARIWDATSGAELLTLVSSERYPAYGVAFSPDGRILATADVAGVVTLWNAESGALLRSLAAHVPQASQAPLASLIFRLNFSPDGHYLATAGWDGTAAVWEVASGDEMFRLEVLPPGTDMGVGQALRVNQALFSGDNSRLLTASDDGTAQVWEIASALSGGPLPTEPLLTLAGHASTVWDVALSPDGSRLATVGFDGLTKVWDGTTGRELLTFADYSAGPDVTFSPDGRYLLTAGVDGAVRVHVLPVEELTALARSRLTRWWRLDECRRFLHMGECPAEP